MRFRMHVQNEKIDGNGDGDIFIYYLLLFCVDFKTIDDFKEPCTVTAPFQT